MACYYEARGFSPYYFAHVIFNVVKTPGAFARNLEGFMGDLAAGAWCEPFPRFSNLHRFIEEITDDLIFEPAEEENGPAYFVRFCRHYGAGDWGLVGRGSFTGMVVSVCQPINRSQADA